MTDGIRNAIIKDATIRIERGFILDVWLRLDYGGAGQGFGGWMLSHADKSEPDMAGSYLCNVMKIADVDDWADLKGKTIRCDIKGGLIKRIGHILKDQWFEPERLWEATQ